ncbi:MAG: GntR family transcriptional regulator [Trebonia sp.]
MSHTYANVADVCIRLVNFRSSAGSLVAHCAPVPATLPARGTRTRGTVSPLRGSRGRKRPKGDPVLAAPAIDHLDADYTPRYITLARQLRGRIEDGTYPHGSLLPSSKRLAIAHEVSKATALHALEMLVQSGHARHVESKPHQVIWEEQP